MEIRVYVNMSKYGENKYLFCSRIASTDVFDFTSCVQLFKSIVGQDCVIVIIAV